MRGQLLYKAVLAAATHVSAARAADGSLEALFGPHLSPGAEIASSVDANFSSVVGPRWSAWEVPAWSGAIKPATYGDIQQIVKIARANNISFIATNGGHGPKINQSHFTGLNVNLGRFSTVSLDATNNIMKVGPGAKLWDVMTTLYNAGKEIQTGNSVCPGVIGVTIGGGVGMMTGMHGLMIDALTSVRMVTAAGDVVTASDCENEDLFWAIRGAGANLGIITEATYTVHEQTNGGNVTAANFVYAASSNRSLWELLRTYDGDAQPEKLGMQAIISYDRPTGSARVLMQLWFFGTVAEAQPHLDAFAALKPIATSIQSLNQTALYYQSVTGGVCTEGATISAYTLGFRRTDVANYEAHFGAMVAFYQANPAYNGISVFQMYSNKVTRRVPVSETVFPWRDIQTWWLLENIYQDTSLEPAIARFGEAQRASLQTTSGFDVPHVYLNYALGDEGPAAWWSEGNLPRLRRLKAKWDPTNMFGNGAPVF